MQTTSSQFSISELKCFKFFGNEFWARKLHTTAARHFRDKKLLIKIFNDKKKQHCSCITVVLNLFLTYPTLNIRKKLAAHIQYINFFRIIFDELQISPIAEIHCSKHLENGMIFSPPRYFPGVNPSFAIGPSNLTRTFLPSFMRDLKGQFHLSVPLN